MFFSSSKRELPSRVPTDQVVPAHFWDDTTMFRSVVMYYMARFDDVLDVDKLEGALARLINRDGWRKLGGRLRLNDQKKLEYHIPAAFDQDRRPFVTYRERHETSISAHPLASRLPRASSSPQIVGCADDFIPLMRQSDDPTSIDDYIYTDRPMLGLHVLAFNDATLITLNWSHVVMDGMGRKALLEAWSLVLQGRDDEVPPFHGFETDPLATLGTQPTETYAHADKQFGILGMIIFGVRFLIDQLFYRPVSESRVICVPSDYVQSLKDTATSDLATLPPGDSPADTRFVSEGDVMASWWTRWILSSVSVRASQTVALNIAFGMRWLLGGDLLPKGSAHILNAVTYAPTFMTVRDVIGKPLGHVAYAVRQSLAHVGSRAQIEARLAIDRASQLRTGNGALFGDPWMHMVVCTNWTKGNFYQTDFSAAVVGKSERIESSRAGRPTYIQLHAFARGFSLISGFSILGKDADGNIWLQSVLRKEYWAVLARKFKAVSEGGGAGRPKLD